MKGIPVKCDVVVIGGGPAGSIASALLAQKGVDVVLLEKEKFPRYAVGESLIPHFWKFTDAIGASDQIKNAGFVKKAGGFVQWGGVLRTVSFKNFGFTRPALHVERAEFDNILLRQSQALGTKVFEQVVVKGVEFINNEATVCYQNSIENSSGVIQAKYIIDASGQGTLTAKQYDMVTFDKNFRFQALWGYFDHSDYMNSKGEITAFERRFEDPPMTLVSDTGNWGWTWQIVLKDKVSIGTLVPRTKMKEFKNGGSTLEERFLNYIRQTPLVAPLIRHSNLVSKVRTVRDYAYKPEKLTIQNCFLVGDAAAFFDPINSEGITIAMYGASIAAWAIGNALKKPNRIDFYKKAFEKNLQTRLDLFQLLAFPDELIPPHLLQKVKDSILNQSDNENYLTLAQLMLTRRGKDFPQMLEDIGLPYKEVYQEIDIPQELSFNMIYPENHKISILLTLGIYLFLWTSCNQDAVFMLADPYVIKVTGEDFEWFIQHPGQDGQFNTSDDKEQIQHIYLPSKTNVKILLTSCDYLYFFELPEFNQTGIAVPEKTYAINLQTPRRGKYDIKGNQMCGYTHSSLFGNLSILSKASFKEWQSAKLP